MISGLGFGSLADEILNDPSVLEEEPFNATKTWIEYINRLIGVVIGLLIIGVLVASIFRYREDKSSFFWSLAAFILVVFQGWFGSIVVSTNLLPGTISVHMGLALLLVCILIYLAYKTMDKEPVGIRNIQTEITLLERLMAVGMLLFVIQIFLGTQVRESIDLVARNIADRSDWIEQLGLSFYIHRTYSLLILGLHIWMTLKLKKMGIISPVLQKMFDAMVILIIVEVLSGAAMAYFAVPAFLQPLHLLVATMIFGVQFYSYLNLQNLRLPKGSLSQ